MSGIDEAVEWLTKAAQSAEQKPGLDPLMEYPYVHAHLRAQTFAAHLRAVLTELEETRTKYAKCVDLSQQGHSALSDARLFIRNLGTPDDLNEAVQCIDLAQASYCDTIIASENRAQASERIQAEQRETIAELRDVAEALILAYRKKYRKPATTGIRSDAPLQKEVGALNLICMALRARHTPAPEKA